MQHDKLDGEAPMELVPPGVNSFLFFEIHHFANPPIYMARNFLSCFMSEHMVHIYIS